MSRRARLGFLFTALAVISLLAVGCGGGDEMLSEEEFRFEVGTLCGEPEEILARAPPTLDDSPDALRGDAERFRTVAKDLRDLSGPTQDEELAEALARKMDRMAEVLEETAAAIETGDSDALSTLVSDERFDLEGARPQVLTACLELKWKASGSPM